LDAKQIISLSTGATISQEVGKFRFKVRQKNRSIQKFELRDVDFMGRTGEGRKDCQVIDSNVARISFSLSELRKDKSAPSNFESCALIVGKIFRTNLGCQNVKV
jgi:hypothetical protein